MTGSRSGAGLFVDALSAYGVDYVFGNPGTTELPIVKAIANGDPEYVLALHEDVAVGAAAGYAKARRYHAADGGGVMPVGVANLHLAPGTAHGLGNLYGASVAGAPVLVTAGNHGHDFRHEEPSLSGDTVEMTRQFTKWSAEVHDVDALPTMLRRAFRVALTPPTGPVFLSLPMDVMLAETDGEPERLGPIPDAGRGDPAQVARAADALVDAEDPVLVVGDGVARSGVDAVEAAVDLAEAAGARVHGEALACEVDFPVDHDQWVSLLRPDADLIRTALDADTVVLTGCSTNTTLTRHADPLVDVDTTFVHLSDDAWEVGKNQPADVAVLGDPGHVLAAVADRVADRLSDDVRATRLDRVAEAKRGARSDDPAGDAADAADDPRFSKADLARAVRDAAPDAFLVDEAVSAKYALLDRFPLRPGGFLGNKGGGLGFGLPVAIGAAVAEAQRPEPRKVVAHVGDGSYLYYPNAIYTAARYDLDVAVFVPDNRNYRVLKDNMAGLFDDVGEGDFAGLDFDPAVDIAANARSHGADGRFVEPDDDLGRAAADAVETDGPVVVDVPVHD